MDEQTLRSCVSKLGWDVQTHGQGTFRSDHRTDEGDMQIYLRLSGDWFVASVVPFLATKGNNSFELSRWLLRMNHDLSVAKFAFDEDGDVTLTVELPTENLDEGEVEWALNELLTQATHHRAVLREAAETP
ncbi:MAG: YbjN domain-containing protein [Myxococcota bacterium]